MLICQAWTYTPVNGTCFKCAMVNKTSEHTIVVGFQHLCCPSARDIFGSLGWVITCVMQECLCIDQNNLLSNWGYYCV